LVDFRTFIAEERGAVTTDWVVLVAAAIGLVFAAFGVVSDGIEGLSTEISSDLASIDATAPPF